MTKTELFVIVEDFGGEKSIAFFTNKVKAKMYAYNFGGLVLSASELLERRKANNCCVLFDYGTNVKVNLTEYEILKKYGYIK